MSGRICTAVPVSVPHTTLHASKATGSHWRKRGRLSRAHVLHSMRENGTWMMMNKLSQRNEWQLDPRGRAVLFLFARTERIIYADVAKKLAPSRRMARNLLTDWVEEGWLEIADLSRRGRVYSLSVGYWQFIGNDRLKINLFKLYFSSFIKLYNVKSQVFHPVKNSVFGYEVFIDGRTVNEGSLYGFWYRKYIITLKS